MPEGHHVPNRYIAGFLRVSGVTERATITKTKAGTFKAIIRKNSKVIKTKTFRLKKDARTWSKRIEGDRDAMTAFGSPGASIQFNQLADEYLKQWTGKDNITGNVKFWKAQLVQRCINI